MATRPSNPTPAKVPAAAPKTGGEVSTVTRSTSLVSKMAAKMQMEPERFLETLKQTAFRQRGSNGQPAIVVSNEQMAMLLHIADKYGLDPFVREIYAFQTDGGISPIIPIDGWISMINRHPMLGSMEIETAPAGTSHDEYWCAVTITRKDREKPIRIEEWMKECYRETGPWQSHPRRMLRHKAIIQCGRVAFGYSGIFDPDEEERIFNAAKDVTPPRTPGKPVTTEPRQKPIDVPAARPSDVKFISVDQITAILDKCKEEGVELTALCARYELGVIEDLPEAYYREALATIDELSKS